MAPVGRKQATTRRPALPRARLAIAAAIGATVLVSCVALVEPARGALAALALHATHVAAAFTGGLLLLRLPRAAPRAALELWTSALALGLAAMSLLMLIAAVVGLTHPAVPWAIDALLVAVGARHLPRALERLEAGGRRLDLSVVGPSHAILAAGAATFALPFLALPFTPLVPGLGAGALALPSQVGEAGSLGAALAALPGTSATPVEGLLLHGWLADGAVGARLHVVTLVAVLALAVGAHAARHLGGRAIGWALVALLGAPALLRIASDQPAQAWVATFTFLAFREISDWSAEAAGGKIALASILGGLAAAESPGGLVAFLALLAFLTLQAALFDRQSPVRLAGGVGGMVLIALVAAAPHVITGTVVAGDDPREAVRDRALPSMTIAAVAGERAAAEGGHGRSAGDQSGGALVDAALTLLGPGVIAWVLLAFLLLGPPPSEGLRHALLASLLLTGTCVLPRPWSSGWALLGPLALLAGAAGARAIAGGGRAATLVRCLGAVACLIALVHSLASVPPLLPAAAAATKAASTEDFLDRHLPDRDLIRVVSLRSDLDDFELLLLGDLTVARYPGPVRTRLPDGPPADWPPLLVAVDHATAPSSIDVNDLELVTRADRRGRYGLYRSTGGP